MRNTVLLAALSWTVVPAYADLAAESPDKLCSLLREFDINTSAFESPGEGERPLCYTASDPEKVKGVGYEYSYRVLSHWEWDFVDSLFLQVQGSPERILGKEPSAKFAKMSERILSAFLEEHDKLQVLLALQALLPGEHKHGVVRGINVQLSYVDYSLQGLGPGVEFRIDLGNVCNYSPQDADGRQACITEHQELLWSPSRF